MKTRIVAVALIVVGLGLTAAGLFGQIILGEDEGHHDGRESTFALASSVGADTLIVEEVPTSAFDVSIERAGQTLVGYDDLHEASFHAFAVSRDLTNYVHAVFPDPSTTGVYRVGPLPDGEHRVVVQAAPAGGPDLLEVGIDVTSDGGGMAGQFISGDDVWTDDTLTVTRQGFDFVLSEPWSGQEYRGSPAFLALFRGDDLAFLHQHAGLVGDDRFSFAVDLPGRGEYLAAVEFIQNGELVTALFRFEV